MTVAEVIALVARRHGFSENHVGGIIRDAIEELIQVVDSGGEVKVRGLGTFYWQVARGRPNGTGACAGPIPEGLKLRFRPARRFRTRRRKMSDTDGMTKYGVELDDTKTKQASEKAGEAGRCPTCSRKLDDAGACSVHGTEPLEPTEQPSRR